MKSILVLAAIACFVIGAFALTKMRTDIQLIVALGGLGQGFVLIGLIGVLNRLERIANAKT